MTSGPLAKVYGGSTSTMGAGYLSAEAETGSCFSIFVRVIY